MSNLILREHMQDVLYLARDLNVDTGVARDIYLNAVRHGGVSAGEDPAVQAAIAKLAADVYWAPLKARYEAQTDAEREADLADYAEAVREHLGQKT